MDTLFTDDSHMRLQKYVGAESSYTYEGYSVRLRTSGPCYDRSSYSNVSEERDLLSGRSVVHTSSEQERDRIEADLLVLVVFAHMACRTANGLSEAANARIQFIDAVRALHYAVAGDAGPQESAAPASIM